MYVRTYVRMYVCVCMYVCLHVMYVRTYVYMCIKCMCVCACAVHVSCIKLVCILFTVHTSLGLRFLFITFVICNRVCGKTDE